MKSPQSKIQLTDVVFVSAAPLNSDFRGGFSARHASFVEAVASRHPATLIFLHDGDDSLFRSASVPSGVETQIVNGLGATGHGDLRLPRQAVSRTVRSPGCGPRSLLIPLTASVAHVALGHRNTMAVLEEGWERLRPVRPDLRMRALAAAERYRYRDLYRRLASWITHAVVITPREKDHFSGYLSACPISVVPYGVDTRYFAPVPTTTSDIDVLIVGAVNSRLEQRVEDLIQGLRNHSRTTNSRCVVVGGSPRESILRLASSKVEITGEVPDVRPYYARAKVVVVPTKSDIGIKTTMLQAWAMERPVVTTRMALDATPHGAFQARLATDDIGQMAHVIADLLVDRDERSRLGRAARNVVLEHHERNACAQLFARIVDGCMVRGPT